MRAANPAAVTAENDVPNTGSLPARATSSPLIARVRWNQLAKGSDLDRFSDSSVEGKQNSLLEPYRRDIVPLLLDAAVKMRMRAWLALSMAVIMS